MQSLADWGGEAVGSALACVVAILVLTTSLSAGSLGVACASTVLMVAFFAAIRRLSHQSLERAWNTQQRVADLVGDALNGRIDIVGNGRTEVFLLRCEEELKSRQRTMRNSDFLTAMVGRGPQVVLGAAIVVVFISTATIRARDLILVVATLPAFGTLTTSLYQLHRASVRLRPVLQLLSKVTPVDGTPLATRFDELSLRRVTVSLGDRTVLDEVSWTTRRGEVTILTGVNGSGKSTVLHTVVALAPYQGSLLLGRQELSQVNPARWREHVVFLSQKPYLPSRRSVGYAMSILEPNVPADDIRRALDRMGVLERLSRGHAEPMDVQVDALSAGERQRVALARVLLGDADVYLLDEPDANLDATGVTLVAKLLTELADAGKIVVVAAHTPELIACGDRVVHLEAGRVTRIDERAPRERSPNPQ
jgi:ABC-type multidrug transport system fused ATPase/permease subunit